MTQRRTEQEKLAFVPHDIGVSTTVPFGIRVAAPNGPRPYRELANGFQILIAIHRNRHSHQVRRILVQRERFEHSTF